LQVKTANAGIEKKMGVSFVNHVKATQVDLHIVAKYSTSVDFSNANECGLIC